MAEGDKKVEKKEKTRKQPKSAKYKLSDPYLFRHEGEEVTRLIEEEDGEKKWKMWGPYLSDRQWGTVREDYSHDGNHWEYFPHDMARSRAYRWGEDGIFGFSDNLCRMCFSVALWNGKDDYLKERFYGVNKDTGNHGEDVKDYYFYKDATPTHSYMRAMYKYPFNKFPYQDLRETNANRSMYDREYELTDTGIFDQNENFDVVVEYAKQDVNDMICQITVKNVSQKDEKCYVLPQVWFRNTWSWGRIDGGTTKPTIKKTGDGKVEMEHQTLGKYYTYWKDNKNLIFCENETNYQACDNAQKKRKNKTFSSRQNANLTKKKKKTDVNKVRVSGRENESKYTKDGFHRYVCQGEKTACNNEQGTKAAGYYELQVGAGKEEKIWVRFCAEEKADPWADFAECFDKRKKEADEFYKIVINQDHLNDDEKRISRQAYSNLIWNKQFYNYVVAEWLDGDMAMPLPDDERHEGRNRYWRSFFGKDIISSADKWEYPFLSGWDNVFHMIPFSKIDPSFTKQQLELYLREWYMTPNGHMPAWEEDFDAVQPPVHALGVINMYKNTAERGARDQLFLVKTFNKLCANYTWWCNRRDEKHGKILGGQGYMGMDTFGPFHKNQPFHKDHVGNIEQMSSVVWMGYYTLNMLNISIDLAFEDRGYEAMAVKFFHHFILALDALNNENGGFWNEQDGFYYDRVRMPNGHTSHTRVRSMVGMVPLFSCLHIKDDIIRSMPELKKTIEFTLRHRPELQAFMYQDKPDSFNMFLSMTSKHQMQKMMHHLLDDYEFYSKHGIRSLSKYHEKRPFQLEKRDRGTEHDYKHDGDNSNPMYTVEYTQSESKSQNFGQNNNWRGPVWMPINYMVMEALERYDNFYGKKFQMACPTGSGNMMRMKDIALDIAQRVSGLFTKHEDGTRTHHGDDHKFQKDKSWAHEILFYEYYSGESGRGCGANHLAGWNSLITNFMDRIAARRKADKKRAEKKDKKEEAPAAAE
jgi:hypothetical protein